MSNNPYNHQFSEEDYNPYSNYTRGHSENYAPYNHGGFVHEDDDYTDYHQDTDYDDYGEEDSDEDDAYPEYYNHLIREHYAKGGTTHNLPAYLRAAATKFGSAAHTAGKHAYRLGQNALAGLRYAGNRAYQAGQNLYNRMPANPFRRPQAGNRAAPRTWADTMGGIGNTAGTVAGSLGGRAIGTGAGAIFGPVVARQAASTVFPYVPGMLRNPVAGLVGGMTGAPLGGYLGQRVGQRVGAHLGEGVGRIAGRGIDYLAGQAVPAMQTARGIRSRISARVGPMARSAASTLGNVMAHPSDYTPGAIMQRRAGNAFSAGMPAVEALRAQAPRQQGWGEYLGNAAQRGMDYLNTPVNALARLANEARSASRFGTPPGGSPRNMPEFNLAGSFGMPGQYSSFEERRPLVEDID